MEELNLTDRVTSDDVTRRRAHSEMQLSHCARTCTSVFHLFTSFETLDPWLRLALGFPFDNFLPCSSLNPRSSLLLSYPSNISASATTTLCSTDPSSALDPLVLMCRRTHTYTVHCTVASCNTCFKCFKTISTFRKALRSSACLGSLCSARGSFFRLQCKVCSRSAQTQALCLHGAARALRVYNTTDDERRPNCARRGGGTPNRTECVGESEARSDQA